LTEKTKVNKIKWNGSIPFDCKTIATDYAKIISKRERQIREHSPVIVSDNGKEFLFYRTITQ
jgi:hypothetical protein